jgi:bifunctional non-homologous end joining protein LigD
VLLPELERRRRAKPACAGLPSPLPSGAWFVAPELVAEVRYSETTSTGMLRHPVFVALRDDVPPGDCHAPGARASEPPQGRAEGSPDGAPDAQLKLTRLEKVFWPAQGYTKGDLLAYYERVWPWLAPYLKDRPLVLTRYPDGIEGKSFFQKDAPGFAPGWVRLETMWSEHARREIRYFVCDDEETLLYVANMASIPLHVWSSRVASLQSPDWCILDLDPKGAPFAHVVEVAKRIRGLCAEIELPCFVKTSGSTGLHVLIPLGRQCTYEQSRTLAQLLARVVVSQLPAIATLARALRDRQGKVYVDHVQNGHGRLLVAPFSVRPLPGAPVSTPLRWSEVNAGLDTKRFNIATVPARMKRMKIDPMRDVLEATPDLLGALARLHETL